MNVDFSNSDNSFQNAQSKIIKLIAYQNQNN